jgi:phosphoribosylanthranilate isomerase
VANATKLVALVVNPDQAALTRVIETVRPDVVQFHGSESDALLLLARKHGVEVWRALPVSNAEDVRAAQRQTVPDRLLFDARPPAGADRAGGWGHSFDWGLLAGANFAPPWLLAGGLTPLTVALAVRQTGALAVDVSSGVERAPGRKCPHLMRTFIAEARSVSLSRFDRA